MRNKLYKSIQFIDVAHKKSTQQNAKCLELLGGADPDMSGRPLDCQYQPTWYSLGTMAIFIYEGLMIGE